ncbi:MAG TPA: signal recognition particle subunit SRP19/SEC65 family protein [Methanomassiliicoccales archaeon]|nr:signal recognition particle subunit SRP19/SEC65 family protein [Methanomassiliicoccales archaeon]
MDEEKAWVLWPEYFDASRTRAAGRKVKKSLAVANPNLEMLEKAVQKLGLEYKVEAEKAFPGAWYEKKGRLLVDRTIAKSELLPKVGELLVRSQRS